LYLGRLVASTGEQAAPFVGIGKESQKGGQETLKIDLERPRDINSAQLASHSTEIMRALKGYVTAEVAE
jgi:hypothetical protein